MEFLADLLIHIMLILAVLVWGALLAGIVVLLLMGLFWLVNNTHPTKETPHGRS